MSTSWKDKENRRKCFKCGKSPVADNIKLFRFPKPAIRNLQRCTLWAKFMFPLEESQYSSIKFHTMLFNEHRMLCQDNFLAKDFADDTKQKLLRDAVPYMAEDSIMPQPFFDTTIPGPSRLPTSNAQADTSKAAVLMDIGNISKRPAVVDRLRGPRPSGGGPGNFKVMAHSEEEERAFDYQPFRDVPKPTGVVGSVAHMVKGALGGGVLSAHVSYMKAGVATAVPINILLGLYMATCLHLLVQSSQRLYRRTRVPSMSYPDVGEAAMACFPNPKVQKFSKCFRYCIDVIICIDLFGACACYQLIIANTIIQLSNTKMDIRIVLALMIVPLILICLITHLKWLAPFSLVANITVAIAIIMAVVYAFRFNPDFGGMKLYTAFFSQFEYIGMLVFGMSCAGVVIPIENNMKEPHKFKYALFVGMSLIVMCTFLVSFFGYAAFLDECKSPITLNFPGGTATNVFKGCVAAMIYVTHALNFWPPFNLVFYYLKKRHDPTKALKWELIYRAIIVTCIAFIAIVFPSIDNLMGFLGTFCLSNMAFIWPNVITILVIYERPGYGKYKWRLWRLRYKKNHKHC